MIRVLRQLAPCPCPHLAAAACALLLAVGASPVLAGPLAPGPPVQAEAPKPDDPEPEAVAGADRAAAGSPEERSFLESRAISPDAGGPDAELPRGNNAWILQTGGALAVVLGLIFALRFAVTRAARSSGSLSALLGPGGRAPSGVLEVLGRYPVGRGQTLVLLKLDRRVLLVSQTSQGFSTLTQLTDPDEVASVLVKTRDEEGESLAARFKSMLSGFERDHSIVSDEFAFPGREEPAPRRARLFGGSPEAGSQEVEEPVGAGDSELRRRIESLRGLA